MTQGKDDPSRESIEQLRHELTENLSKVQGEIDDARTRGDLDHVVELQDLVHLTERITEDVRRFQLAELLLRVTGDHGHGPYSREQLAALSGLSESDVELGMSQLR